MAATVRQKAQGHFFLASRMGTLAADSKLLQVCQIDAFSVSPSDTQPFQIKVTFPSAINYPTFIFNLLMQVGQRLSC